MQKEGRIQTSETEEEESFLVKKVAEKQEEKMLHLQMQEATKKEELT